MTGLKDIHGLVDSQPWGRGFEPRHHIQDGCFLDCFKRHNPLATREWHVKHNRLVLKVKKIVDNSCFSSTTSESRFVAAKLFWTLKVRAKSRPSIASNRRRRLWRLYRRRRHSTSRRRTQRKMEQVKKISFFLFFCFLLQEGIKNQICLQK